MNKNFSKVLLTALTAGMAMFSAVSAANYCDPCDPCYDPCCDMFGGFEIGADFLWWQPCIDDIDFAATFTPTYPDTGTISTDIAIKRIDHDYEPGVRGWIKIEDIWCKWNLMGSYTYLHSEETGRVEESSGNNVQSILVHPDVIAPLGLAGDTFIVNNSKHKVEYQSFDVLLGREFTLAPCNMMTPFMGIEGVSICRRMSSEFQDAVSSPTVTGTFAWDGDFRGLGLKFGTEMEIAMCDGIAFFGRASGTIVAGENCVSSTSNTNNGTAYEIRHKSDDRCLLMPGYHLMAGMSYTTCWCDWDFSARLGYEFLEWRNAPQIRRFYEVTDGTNGHSSHDSGQTVGFHGLFAGLSVGF